MSRNHRIAAAAIGVAVLVPAATAHAATRNVVVGPPAKVAGVPGDSDSNAYFRKQIKIHIGDRVRWRFNGFHTVTVPAKGDDPPPFIGQDASGTKISGVNDAAGNPFWFNGQTRITLSDAGALPQGGSRYNGNRLASSGAPLQPGPPRPYTLRFTRKGTYSYYCTIHPGMKGTVKVVARGTRIPTNRANKLAGKREYARVVARLKKDDKFPGRLGNAVEAGHDTLTTTFLRFFPATKNVPVGTTVTFLMSPKTTESHTISFGPADYLKQQSDAFITPDPINPQLPPVVSPIAAFPSEPPPQAPLDPTQHGNGFFNTGVLDRDNATPLNPGEARVTFNTPGTYNFICLIHPEMKGSIVVG